MLLKTLLEKTELNSKDTLKSAFGKGMLEGALDGLVILGVLVFVEGLLTKKKWE